MLHTRSTLYEKYTHSAFFSSSSANSITISNSIHIEFCYFLGSTPLFTLNLATHWALSMHFVRITMYNHEINMFNCRAYTSLWQDENPKNEYYWTCKIDDAFGRSIFCHVLVHFEHWMFNTFVRKVLSCLT